MTSQQIQKSEDYFVAMDTSKFIYFSCLATKQQILFTKSEKKSPTPLLTSFLLIVNCVVSSCLVSINSFSCFLLHCFSLKGERMRIRDDDDENTYRVCFRMKIRDEDDDKTYKVCFGAGIVQCQVKLSL